MLFYELPKDKLIYGPNQIEAMINQNTKISEQAVYVPKGSRAEGEAALLGVPIYIGGLAGGLAVVASGGAMALAFAAAIGLGAVGAGLGGLLARVVAHRHVFRVREQLAQCCEALVAGGVAFVHREQALRKGEQRADGFNHL
jgi:hypothetical protein